VSGVAATAAQAAPGAAWPLRWQVVTLRAPAGASSAEPGIAIGADGTALIDAASANTGAPPTMWMSRDRGGSWDVGRSFDTSGASTGDSDVAIGADGYLYALNLAYNPNPPGQPANPTVLVYRSRDGHTWLGPASFPAPHGFDQPDRPWLVVDPAVPADVDVVNSEGGGNVVMWRSTDHGATFAGPVTVSGGDNGQAALALSSRPLVQPGDHRRLDMLYETVGSAGTAALAEAGPPLGEFPMSQLWLAESRDAGATWSNSEVLDTATLTDSAMRDGTLAHLLVASAIDAAGNLYAAFSLRPEGNTTTHIYLIHSVDHGATWRAPLQVESPLPSNVMPALAVSRNGTVYLSWYASAATDYRDGGARWVEMVAATPDVLSSHPHFNVEQISGADPVHVGGIDAAGTIGNDLGANWGLRDFQSIAVDGCGRPHPVWAVDAGRVATQTAMPLIPCAASATSALRSQVATVPQHGLLPDTAPSAASRAALGGAGLALAAFVAAARRRRSSPG